MKIKNIFYLFFLSVFLLTLFNSVNAVSFSFDKQAYFKGDTMVVSGTCEGNENFSLNFLLGKKEICECDITCESGKFSYSYQTTFLDPSGIWDIVIGNVVKSIEILPKRESNFLSIVFLNPSPGTHYRTEDINISVKITELQENVEDANVAAWAADGKKLYLSHKGKGVYSTSYEIPYNAPVGDSRFIVTAETGMISKRGGENYLSLEIEEAPIIIEFQEPKVSNYDFGAILPVRVRATYFNNKPIIGPILKVKIGSQEFPLAKQPSNYFSSNIDTKLLSPGSYKLAVSAVDSAFNQETESLNIIINEGLFYYLTTHGIYTISIVLIAIAGLLFFRSRFKKFKKKTSLHSEKKLIESKIEKLQKDYFEKSLSKEIYDSSMADLQARLKEVKRELNNNSISKQKQE